MTVKEIVMGCDGGTVNFAVSLVDMAPPIPQPVYSALLTATITNATNTETIKKWKADVAVAVPDFDASSRLFQQNIRNIIAAFGPVSVSAERFQTRGFGGPTIEHIAMMNAFIFVEAGEARRRLLPAAEWKAKVNSYRRLDTLYPMAENIGLTHHHLDSTFISIYGANGDLSWLTNEQHTKKFLQNLQRVVW